MDYSIPITLRSDLPLKGCKCNMCEAARAEQERPRSNSFTFNMPTIKDRYEGFSFESFEPEQAAEPVYTHVLLDYDEGDSPDYTMAELHTAESLLRSLEYRWGTGASYKVFKLGPLILDVSE